MTLGLEEYGKDSTEDILGLNAILMQLLDVKLQVVTGDDLATMVRIAGSDISVSVQYTNNMMTRTMSRPLGDDDNNVILLSKELNGNG
mmetsp:Transcript_40605/g.49411  ORF Transcript_40605/g.49411 Transcript_40605/m.49411 type:complete len:88 (+) Transcript_40605:237-500(+)